MTQAEIAEALRTIDTLAAETRRALLAGIDPQSGTVRGYLLGIQGAAQAALQDIEPVNASVTQER